MLGSGSLIGAAMISRTHKLAWFGLCPTSKKLMKKELKKKKDEFIIFKFLSAIYKVLLRLTRQNSLRAREHFTLPFTLSHCGTKPAGGFSEGE